MEEATQSIKKKSMPKGSHHNILQKPPGRRKQVRHTGLLIIMASASSLAVLKAGAFGVLSSKVERKLFSIHFKTFHHTQSRINMGLAYSG